MHYACETTLMCIEQQIINSTTEYTINLSRNKISPTTRQSPNPTDGVSPQELLDGVAAASVAVGVASQRLRLRAGPASLPGVWSHELRPGDLPAFTSSLSHAVVPPKHVSQCKRLAYTHAQNMAHGTPSLQGSVCPHTNNNTHMYKSHSIPEGRPGVSSSGTWSKRLRFLRAGSAVVVVVVTPFSASSSFFF